MRRVKRNRKDRQFERLEARRMFTVTVTPLADLTVSPHQFAGNFDLAGVFASDSVHGTVVRLATTAGLNGPSGKIDIELYDVAFGGHSAAPVSTANFLSYVNSGSYAGTFFHRATDFAGDHGPAVFLQGGGFTRTDATHYGNVATNAPINLEYASDRPNAAGTIAYARTGDPNSATSGFFFNVAANPSFDSTGNQYAVFGHVIGSSQSVLDSYAGLTRVNAGGPFTTLPVTQTTNFDLDDTVIVTGATVLASPNLSLTYAVQSSDTNVVTPSIDGTGHLKLSYGTRGGTATVTVTGTDLTGASAQDAFTVTVQSAQLAVSLGGTPLANGATIDFGTVARSSGAPVASAFQTLTLTNTGTLSLDLLSILVPSSADYVLPSQQTLAPGESAELKLALDPTTAGAKSGNVNIVTNDASSPFLVALSGTVIVPARLVVKRGTNAIASGGSVSLGSTTTGTAGTVVLLTISNAGQTPLTFSGVTASAGFKVSGDTLTELASGASGTIGVEIDSAAAAGALSGTLSIATDDESSPFTVALSGVLEREVVLSAALGTVTFKDADGTVSKVTFKGPGSATLGMFGTAPLVKGKAGTVAGVSAIHSVVLNGTGAKSALTISGKGGNNGIVISTVTANAAIGQLSLASATITDSLVVSSAGTVAAATLAGSGTFGGSVTTVSLGSASSLSLSAAGAIKAFTVKGAVNASTLSFTGGLTTFAAGTLAGSRVKVGVAGTSPEVPVSAADFLAVPAMKSFTLTSKLAGAFSNSALFVGNLGTASLGMFSATASDSSTIIAHVVTGLGGKGPAGKAFSVKPVKAPTTYASTIVAAGLPSTRFVLSLV